MQVPTDKESKILELYWVVFVLLGVLYLVYDVGGIPHDDGSVCLSARRFLSGEIPHKDFDSLYTGLLTFVHAFGFWVFGENILVPRLILAGFTLVTYLALFKNFRIFLSFPEAFFFVLVALVWGPASYFAPMPSWYFLFGNIWIVTILFSYLDKEENWKLGLAGIVCGLSLLVKVTALYSLAGILLFILYQSSPER